MKNSYSLASLSIEFSVVQLLKHSIKACFYIINYFALAVKNDLPDILHNSL